MKLKKIILPLFLIYSCNSFSFDQFAAAEKRAKLAMEVCGNGHTATIVMGKVTECDGNPVVSITQKGPPPAPNLVPIKDPVAKNRKEEKVVSIGCGRKDEYVFCSDGIIYEKVNPEVAVQLRQQHMGSNDSPRTSQKDISRAPASEVPSSAGRSK